MWVSLFLFGARRCLVSHWHVPCVKKVSAIRLMRHFVYFLNKFLLLHKAETLRTVCMLLFLLCPGRNVSRRSLPPPPPPPPEREVHPLRPAGSPQRPIFICYFKNEIKKEAKHDPAALHKGGGGGVMLRFRPAMSAMSWSKCTFVTSDSEPSRISTLIKKCWFGYKLR